MYVRMGDLSGGQMIAKRSGSTKFNQFDEDVD